MGETLGPCEGPCVGDTDGPCDGDYYIILYTFAYMHGFKQNKYQIHTYSITVKTNKNSRQIIMNSCIVAYNENLHL